MSMKERTIIMSKRIGCLAACLTLITTAGASTSVTAAAAAAVNTSGSAGAATAVNTGPKITVAPAKLRAAIDCKGNLAHPRKDPVLLIPGTFAWGQINWGWNYQKLLPTLGHPACTLTFPADGAGDIQAATQYAVYAIRMMVEKSAHKIVLMGHSQGGLEARWALRWWPDLRSDVAQVITLAAPNGGALYTNQHCNVPDSCSASLYQMRSDSKFLSVLDRGSTLTWGIPWTSIGTTSDAVFVLPSEAALRGSQNFTVQQLCPDHQVQHVNLAYDGPASAIVLDALSHGGHVKLTRINRAVCNTAIMPGVSAADVNAALAQYNVILARDLGPNGPHAQGEPALACYVTGSCHTHARRARNSARR
jgi:pimeloyl-ACP methyl ester carboxylesterase